MNEFPITEEDKKLPKKLVPSMVAMKANLEKWMGKMQIIERKLPTLKETLNNITTQLDTKIDLQALQNLIYKSEEAQPAAPQSAAQPPKQQQSPDKQLVNPNKAIEGVKDTANDVAVQQEKVQELSGGGTNAQEQNIGQ